MPLEVDNEVLIDASASAPADASTVVTPPKAVEEDTAMQIDEEGRPKFAPAKPSVRFLVEEGDAYLGTNTLPSRELRANQSREKLPSHPTE